MRIKEAEILRELSQLQESQLDKVKNYIKKLLFLETAKENKFLQFAGNINSEDIKQMKKAIEDGCENIDKNEWQ
jgi:hypothetical protein